jgi:adenosylcobinamide-GDP ribazoletransferase
MNQSSQYFPLVGLLLGGLSAGCYLLLSQFWPLSVTLVLVLMFHLWLTGAFHEDGLADSLDALGGGYTVEKRLEIMKDSRIGTYGAAALFSVLALKLAAWYATPQLWLVLVVVPCIARLTPLIFMTFMPYVTASETSKTKPVAQSFSRWRLLAVLMFVGGVASLAGVFVAALWAVILTLVVWGWILRRDLGGYTGDTLGASVIITELLLLLFLLE